MKIVSSAQDRLFAEEIDELERINGPRAIESGICTDFFKGLKGDDFLDRTLKYGNNLKPTI